MELPHAHPQVMVLVHPSGCPLPQTEALNILLMLRFWGRHSASLILLCLGCHTSHVVVNFWNKQCKRVWIHFGCKMPIEQSPSSTRIIHTHQNGVTSLLQVANLNLLACRRDTQRRMWCFNFALALVRILLFGARYCPTKFIMRDITTKSIKNASAHVRKDVQNQGM